MPDLAIALTLVPSPEHALADHPESPDRFRDLALLRAAPFADRCRWLQALPAAEADVIARVHPRVYLDALQSACADGPGYLDR